MSAGTQQRGQATGRRRQQEGQSEGAGHARGDGLADDALADRLPRAEKWLPVVADPARNAVAREKAAVAIARQLAVDLWRLFTGQTAADKLGLIHLPDPA